MCSAAAVEMQAQKQRLPGVLWLPVPAALACCWMVLWRQPSCYPMLRQHPGVQSS